MVVIDVNRDTDGGDLYLKRANSYVNDERNLKVGGIGVSTKNPKESLDEMKAVKQYYSKTSGNPLIHLMISYDKKVTTEEQACEFAKKCAEYYGDDFQVLYGTHELERKGSFYHSYLLINSVSYTNGKMFNSSIPNMNKFCDHVSDVTGSKVYLSFK